MFDAVREKGTKVLVQHAALHAAGEVVRLLALLVAASDGGPHVLALVAGQSEATLALFENVLLQETQDALVVFPLLFEPGREEQAVVVGCYVLVHIKLAVQQLIVFRSAAEDAGLWSARLEFFD